MIARQKGERVLMPVLKKISKIIAFVILFLITLEIFLQVGGLYVRFKYKTSNPPILQDNSLRIMFIGDSWMKGWDAIPAKPGYADLTIRALKQLFPDKNIRGYNFGRASLNSSQTIHRFLDNYNNVKPRLLVILTGFNDRWNTQDIITSRKRIQNKIQIDNNYDKDKFSEFIINNLNKIKLVRLFRLIRYNLVYKSKEIKVPCDAADSEYARGFHNILEKAIQNGHNRYGFEKAREYLISNYREKNDYNELYSLMARSFDGDTNKTREYLKNNNLFRPRLITKDFGKNASPFKALEDGLTLLKLLCDQERIIMVLENYPHIGYEKINAALYKIAKKIDAVYVNHYGYFEKKLSLDEWGKVMTRAHVNYKGHEFMAIGLTDRLSNIIRNL